MCGVRLLHGVTFDALHRVRPHSFLPREIPVGLPNAQFLSLTSIGCSADMCVQHLAYLSHFYRNCRAWTHTHSRHIHLSSIRVAPNAWWHFGLCGMLGIGTAMLLIVRFRLSAGFSIFFIFIFIVLEGRVGVLVRQKTHRFRSL